MKLTLLSAALVAAFSLTCASVQAQTNTMAAPASNTMAPAKMAAAKTTPYKGKITAVDASSVTVQGAKGSMTLAITPETKFKGGKAITDFAVGDAVTGSFTKDSTGAMTAYSVHKKSKK